MSRSKFQPRKSLEGRIPDAPSPTLMLQKLSQSLPLIFHLMISSAVFFYTFLLSILTHLIDGPILDSWDLQTTILHSMLKSVLLTNPPQGRHSLDIVRFATSFKVPKFVFKNTTIQETSITLQNAENFSQQVRDALDIKNLRWKDTPSDVRTVHGEWIIPKVTTPEDDTVVLYLHGGAHIFMSPGTHRGITSEIAKACKARVFAADYRLAPENPFPAGIEDALAAYLALALPEGINGSSCRFNEEFQVVSTTRIFIMGDSSGGCLTLQLLQALRALNLPMPAGAVMLSPFLDHKFDSISWHVNWNYDFLSLDMAGVDWAVEIYSNGTARDHPSISPMYADLKNFPPMLIVNFTVF
ncbi:alpha/beta hydrolase fold-domain-containing protein [Globomyces pollinis-pini]|nr:alpha/beta hydrolase fold-domain-containing protein [Globomyces pollinis-pini]